MLIDAPRSFLCSRRWLVTLRSLARRIGCTREFLLRRARDGDLDVFRVPARTGRLTLYFVRKKQAERAYALYTQPEWIDQRLRQGGNQPDWKPPNTVCPRCGAKERQWRNGRNQWQQTYKCGVCGRGYIQGFGGLISLCNPESTLPPPPKPVCPNCESRQEQRILCKRCERRYVRCLRCRHTYWWKSRPSLAISRD